MASVKLLENTTFYCGPSGLSIGNDSFDILRVSYSTYPWDNTKSGDLVWFGMKLGDTMIDVFTYLKNQGYNTNAGGDIDINKRINMEIEGGDSKCYCFLHNTATSAGDTYYGIEPNVYITASNVDREIKFKWKGLFVFKFILYGKLYVYCALVNITNTSKNVYVVHDADNDIYMNLTPIPAMIFHSSGNRIFYYTNREKTLTVDENLILLSGTNILSGLSTRNFLAIPTYIGEYNSIDNTVKRVKFDPISMNEIGFFTFSSTTLSYLKFASIDISRMSKYYVNE